MMNIEDVREYCLSLPNTTEDMPFGDDILCLRVDGRIFGGSRNLVGIAIQLSDSEEEEFFVGYPMLISPEKFDFGIE